LRELNSSAEFILVVRYLRDVKTGKWIANDGTLTSHLAEAVKVNDLAHALDFVEAHKLQGVLMVLNFGDNRFDATIPVN